MVKTPQLSQTGSGMQYEAYTWGFMIDTRSTLLTQRGHLTVVSCEKREKSASQQFFLVLEDNIGYCMVWDLTCVFEWLCTSPSSTLPLTNPKALPKAIFFAIPAAILFSVAWGEDTAAANGETRPAVILIPARFSAFVRHVMGYPPFASERIATEWVLDDLFLEGALGSACFRGDALALSDLSLFL